MADCVSENMNIICGQQANGLNRYPCPVQPCCPSMIAGPFGFLDSNSSSTLGRP